MATEEGILENAIRRIGELEEKVKSSTEEVAFLRGETEANKNAAASAQQRAEEAVQIANAAQQTADGAASAASSAMSKAQSLTE